MVKVRQQIHFNINHVLGKTGYFPLLNHQCVGVNIAANSQSNRASTYCVCSMHFWLSYNFKEKM